MTFTDEPLHEIVEWVRGRLEPAPPGTLLTFTVLSPDGHAGFFSGERVELGGVTYRHRPYKTWLDLAERLGCRFLTPLPANNSCVTLRFEKLPPYTPWHNEEGTEKYGPDSPFGRVSKLEQPTFLLDYEEALARAALPPGGTVLDLGVNTGDEFEPFARLYPPDVYDLRFVGVDHSESAMARARERFPASQFAFYVADINALGGLELPLFDLVISIGTLQSPGVRDRDLLRNLVQNHLTARGALILGFPNSRYRDGEIIYGARMKNFRQAEMSLLIKDVAFYKKYLQQHRFKVFVTGKYDLLLTAVREKAGDGET